MSDKYDEKAAENFACSYPEGCSGPPDWKHRVNCEITVAAAFGRECAAEAYDMDASYLLSCADTFRMMNMDGPVKAFESAARMVGDKAASLRAPAPSQEKPR